MLCIQTNEFRVLNSVPSTFEEEYVKHKESSSSVMYQDELCLHSHESHSTGPVSVAHYCQTLIGDRAWLSIGNGRLSAGPNPPLTPTAMSRCLVRGPIVQHAFKVSTFMPEARKRSLTVASLVIGYRSKRETADLNIWISTMNLVSFPLSLIKQAC